jgi:hypothetical protein
MSIRFNSAINTAPIDALVERLEGINALVSEVGRDVADRYVPLLERELATNVPPARRKGDKMRWASEDQRKWWFASKGDGKGIPYRRTGDLANAWMIDVTTEGGIFAVKVFNPAPSAKYVYGSLARSITAAKRFQQPFHADQGWPLAVEIIQPVIDDMLDEFVQTLRERLGDLATVAGSGSRAYTGR